MILIGDFNSETEDVCIQSFCEAYELKLLSSNIFAGFSCRFQTSALLKVKLLHGCFSRF